MHLQRRKTLRYHCYWTFLGLAKRTTSALIIMLTMDYFNTTTFGNERDKNFTKDALRDILIEIN